MFDQQTGMKTEELHAEIADTLHLLYDSLNRQAMHAIEMKRRAHLDLQAREHAQGRADALRIPLALLRTYPRVYQWLCDMFGDYTEQWSNLETTTKYIPPKGG